MATNFAFFVDNTLLMGSFAVSIDDISIDVCPSYGSIFPPGVNCTQLGLSFFLGLTSATDLLYVAILPLGIWSFLIQWHVFVPSTCFVPSLVVPQP